MPLVKTFSGRKPSQNEFELRSFIEWLQANNVKRYLEIGARHGDTFHEVMINLPVGSYGLAVDLPGGLWGKSTTALSLQQAVDDLRQRGYVIDVILGDSTKADVINRVAQFAPFGAVLIDGDHRYEGVKSDWINYRDMAEIIAFHDIVGHGQIEKVHGNQVEVPRFWAEIKLENECVVEFVAPGSTMGIGVCNSL
jgi:hypothetical protein